MSITIPVSEDTELARTVATLNAMLASGCRGCREMARRELAALRTAGRLS